MASLLHVGLSNAASATALALAAALVCRAMRGRLPAVAHALWLLVLLKLLTPPLWTLPLPWLPAPDLARPFVPETAPLAMRQPPDADPGNLRHEAPLTLWLPIAEAAPTDSASTPAVARAASDGPDASAPPLRARAGGWLPAVVSAIWLAGSVGCFGLVVFRSFRFRALLRHAAAAPPDVAGPAAALSARLGIKSSPEVWFVPGAVCPMLWAVLGRPRLLLPAELWRDLDAAQRDTLIAHELAHLRRRDHWVRLVEVAATVLYWWHPAVWWARRELREAEEQCCDAWVVWSMPRCARQYMRAILKAVDFVSDAAAGAGGPRVAVPPVASGMASGEFRHLERRLSMIRENENTGRTPAGRTLGRRGWLAVCAGAAGLLPLAPSLARQEGEPRALAIFTAAAEEKAPQAEAEVRVEVHPIPNSDLIQLKSPERSFVLKARSDGTHETVLVPAEGDVLGERGATLSLTRRGPEAGKAAADVQVARAQVERLSAELEAAKARLAAAEATAGRHGQLSVRRAGPATRQLGNLLFHGKATEALAPKGGERDPQRRLDELERKLDRLLDEVRGMKQGQSDDEEPAVPQPHRTY